MPRAAQGPAVDPIELEPVDEVRVTTLVDNSYDTFLPDGPYVTRAAPVADAVTAPQFEDGVTAVRMVAEHGFSALVTVRRGDRTHSILFDTGLSPDAMMTNADRLEIDLREVHSVVLSHGHFDHAGGLAGLSARLGAAKLPMVVHPEVWSKRRLDLPGRAGGSLPTLSKGALQREGYDVIERRVPSLLLDRSVLITGEVDRTTEFERGMPPAHQRWNGTKWEADPLVIDDQALVVNVRDQGLVVVTGCGHAGVINIIRHAQRLTGVARLHALVGGLHLSGPAFEPVIPPTIAALRDLAPTLLVPGHCTGWRAQHSLAASLPDSWVPSSSGSTYHLAA
jgi:7,8-dihydropterin-6-yl-methyl-4-(beta-D-ribofuranosyl)aminobenzene 5'-phosphate synthase